LWVGALLVALLAPLALLAPNVQAALSLPDKVLVRCVNDFPSPLPPSDEIALQNAPPDGNSIGGAHVYDLP
jgi:hypothetical protein